MSKRRLTHQEQLGKMIKGADPSSILSTELATVQLSLVKPRRQAVTELIKLLKTVSQRETQWFIGKVFATVKDERVIRPLLHAALAPQNATHRSNFLWPLENYDCSRYVGQLVKLLLSRLDYDEVVWACVKIIRAMKGPLEPAVARRLIRQLLAEVKTEMDPNDLIALHAIRLEAADKIMALYSNDTLRTFWNKWNSGKWPPIEISETP